jgi:SNF2 family DNA or RNA helicase
MTLREPREHQLRALDYARGKDQIALFMEMRLGKSMVAIRWAQEKPGKRLIVAPLTVLSSWKDELEVEGVEPKAVETLHGWNPKKPLNLKADWFLVNYEALRARPEIFDLGFDAVIFDESTKIRNPQAQISKLLTTTSRLPRRRAILSGLPAPESALDYFTQFKVLRGEFMGFRTFWDFRSRLFHAPAWRPYDFAPRPGALTKIKETIHRHAFVLTRKDANLGPMKVYEKREVAMNPKQKRLYKQVEKDFEYKTATLETATKWATVKFVWLARIAGGFGPVEKEFLSPEKANEILKLLEGELSREKVVIWFRFNRELAYVSEVLERAKIDHEVITGASELDDRMEASKRFRTQEKKRVMLCQVKCGKFGLNWSVASTAIYYSNSYDFEDRAQSEDRILDVGRKEPLLYIDMVSKDSVDESICKTLRQKHVNSRIFMTKLVSDWLERRKK